MILLTKNGPNYSVFYHGAYSITMSTKGLLRECICVGLALFGYRITLTLPCKTTRLYMTDEEWRELMKEDL